MTSDVDKHCIAFGCNPIGTTAIDPLLVRFSDRESAIDWTPTATNQAGGVQLIIKVLKLLEHLEQDKKYLYGLM